LLGRGLLRPLLRRRLLLPLPRRALLLPLLRQGLLLPLLRQGLLLPLSFPDPSLHRLDLNVIHYVDNSSTPKSIRVG